MLSPAWTSPQTPTMSISLLVCLIDALHLICLRQNSWCFRPHLGHSECSPCQQMASPFFLLLRPKFTFHSFSQIPHFICQQIWSVCLWNFSRIWLLLITSTLSRLDYFKAPHWFPCFCPGFPTKARVILSRPKSDHVLLLLSTLQWLPIALLIKS